MSAAVRVARLRSLAKVNLDLRVLHKRADGYHELRTVFQTISLADRIEIAYDPSARTTSIAIEGNVDIPGNLIVTAAEKVMAAARAKGAVRFKLHKQIPMGGGLGGGSSNAAAVLLGLPVLLGRDLPQAKLDEIAKSLGSDINFFLYGGTALGLGRGTELYPLPDFPKTKRGLLVAPGIHVSTGDAFRGLARPVVEGPTTEPADFREAVWALASAGDLSRCRNDFETSVYRLHPAMRRLHSALAKAPGANFVRMSGSGSSIFSFVDEGHAPRFDGAGLKRSILEHCTVHEIETISRRDYRSMWMRQLKEHTAGTLWPPRSRYAQ